MEPSLHCPHAARVREVFLRDGRHNSLVTPTSPRRERRQLHRYFWQQMYRHQPSFQEAWRAFNHTLKGES